MDKNIIDVLICPFNKSNMDLIIFSIDDLDENNIKSGLLITKDEKKTVYPIINGIPRLLKNSLTVYKKIIEDNLDKIPKKHIKHILSHLGNEIKIKKDLLRTQESFSSEWNEIGEEANAWGRTPEVRLKEFLQRTQIEYKNLAGLKILDAGCGNGEVELALKDSGSEIFAIDLSSSLNQIQQKIENSKLTNGTKIHLIQGDVLNIPLKDFEFDVVFSDGVIHHTESVHNGLKEITSKLKDSGKCFVFVYSQDYKNYFDKFLYNFFKLLRVITLLIPHRILHILCYVLSPMHFIAVRAINKLVDKERFKYRSIKETEISLFDALSPVYDWRTSFNDLFDWYSQLGYLEVKKTYYSHVGIGVLGKLKISKD